MVHKRELDMVTDKEPGMEHIMMMMNMVQTLMKASELAPASAPSTYIPLTAGRKLACCLKDNWPCFPCCSL